VSRATGRAGRVGAGILVSRILGVVREQVFAYFLGAGRFSDAFIVAFRIPNLLRDLFAEGALTAGFVPVFSKCLVTESREKAFAFANRVFTLVLFSLGIIVAAGMIGAHPLVRFIAPGFETDPEKFRLTGELVRIVMPYILFVSCAAVAMGILNSLHSYLVPALAPAVFNTVALCAGGVLFALRPQAADAAVIWTWGALLGGVGQLAFQIPALLKNGFRFKPAFPFRDPAVGRFLRLIAPAVFGLAATQINILVNTILASKLESGSVSWLNYAFRLIMLPIGVFGVAIGTVSAVQSARSAAEKNTAKIRADLSSALRLNWFLSISATAGFLSLGQLVVSVLYEHGRFTASDTMMTFHALSLMSLGLFAYSSVKVVVPVFYALADSRVPALASFCAVAANLAVSLSTWKIWGFRGLALGTSAAAVVNFTVLAAAFGRKHGGFLDGRTLLSLGRTLLASATMAGGLILFQWFGLYDRIYEAGKYGRVILTAVLVPVGILIFFLVSLLVRSEEAGLFVGKIFRRNRRSVS
jgi:putative peptidoglycan lipid II flippase